MSYRNIGIDLGVTAMHQAQVCDEQGKKIVLSFPFHISKDNLDALCQKALNDASQGTKLRFICEPTEMSWLPVAIYAKNNCHEIVRVKSHKTYGLRKYFSRHKKNDNLDAGVLCVMPLVDAKATEELYLPDAKTFALERRNRQSEKITKEITAIKNRLSSIYHWLMPGLLDCFNDPFDNRAREFYRHFSNPARAKVAGLDGIKRILEPAGRQKMDRNLPEKLYSVVLNACSLYANSSQYVDLMEIQDEVHVELQLLQAQENSLADVRERIKALYEQVHPSKHIESLKGIGKNLG